MARGGEKKDIGEGFGISGMTLGILSIVSAGFAGLILAIIGFFLCLKQQKNNPTKIGKVGIILSIIGFVLSVFLIIASIFWLGPIMEKFSTTTLA